MAAAVPVPEVFGPAAVEFAVEDIALQVEDVPAAAEPPPTTVVGRPWFGYCLLPNDLIEPLAPPRRQHGPLK